LPYAGELYLNSDHSRSRSAYNYNGGWLRRGSRDIGLSLIAAAVAIGATFNYFCRRFAEPTGARGGGVPSSILSISSDGFAFLATPSGNPTRPSPSWGGFRKDRRTLPVVEGALVYAVRDVPAVSGIVRRHIKGGTQMSINASLRSASATRKKRKTKEVVQLVKRAEPRIARIKGDPRGVRLDDIRSYVDDALKSFQSDLPGTRYQLGYLAAYKELKRLIHPVGYRRDTRRA
jgi:hypothetical protein